MLARSVFGVALIFAACAPLPAQNAPEQFHLFVTPPAGQAPKPFDSSRYHFVLPKAPVTPPAAPAAPNPYDQLRIVLNRKPCAVVRAAPPGPAIDSRMLSRLLNPASPPIEAHSKDLGEFAVPAPSCNDR